MWHHMVRHISIENAHPPNRLTGTALVNLRLFSFLKKSKAKNVRQEPVLEN